MMDGECARMFKALQLVMLIAKSGNDMYNESMNGNPLDPKDMMEKENVFSEYFKESYLDCSHNIVFVYLGEKDDKTISMLANKKFEMWEDGSIPKCPCARSIPIPVGERTIWFIVFGNDEDHKLYQTTQTHPRVDFQKIAKGQPGSYFCFSKEDWNVPHLRSHTGLLHTWPALGEFSIETRDYLDDDDDDDDEDFRIQMTRVMEMMYFGK